MVYRIPEGEPSIVFTLKVLGEETANRLKGRKVVQTIRSSSWHQKYRKLNGGKVQIVLDDRFLYHARITDMQRENLADVITQYDAECGGFATVDDFKQALRRAGFRFKDYTGYTVYRVHFVPVG